MIDDVQQVNDKGSRKKGSGLHNTQQIRTQNYLTGSTHSEQQRPQHQPMLGKQRSGSSGQQPGSRRELPNEKEAVKGVSSSGNRPGTAPQNLNGLLSNGQQQQSKSQRPMSPFTKVYSNSAHGVRTSVSQKNRGGLGKQG